MNRTLPVCPNNVTKEIMTRNFETNCTGSNPCQHTKFQIKEYHQRSGTPYISILSLEYPQEFGEYQHTYVSVDEQTLISKMGGLIGIAFGWAGLSIVPILNFALEYLKAVQDKNSSA